MNAGWDFAIVAISTISGLVVILDWLGIRPTKPLWGLIMPVSRNWKLGIMLGLLMAISFGFSARGYYRSLHPQIVEKIVEKPVDRIVEKVVLADRPKSQTSTPSKRVKQQQSSDSRPASVAAPNVTINAPGGIPITGGSVSNPTVINNGPPPANLGFTEEVVTALSEQNEKSMKVHITTDRSIPGAIVGVIFSGPAEMSKGNGSDDPSLKGAVIQQLNWGGPLISGNNEPIPNSFGIFINAPAAFLPGQELIVPVKSKTDIHVIRVIQVGGVRPGN